MPLGVLISFCRPNAALNSAMLTANTSGFDKHSMVKWTWLLAVTVRLPC